MLPEKVIYPALFLVPPFQYQFNLVALNFPFFLTTSLPLIFLRVLPSTLSVHISSCGAICIGIRDMFAMTFLS
jgi:hypothetical protein